MSSVNTTSLNAATIPGGITQQKTVDSKKQSAMDKDAFLKLLAAQAKSQDPMNPTDSTAQIAQLAQFSSLEQMMNVATEMGKLSATNTKASAIQLVGHDVTFTNPSTGVATTGTVSEVAMSEKGPLLTIGGQAGIDPSYITQVR